MKTRYQFIHFEPAPTKGKMSRWTVLTNRDGFELGIVVWFGPWRQYCFEPSGPSIYSAGCLADIRDFIGQLARERQTSFTQPGAELEGKST